MTIIEILYDNDGCCLDDEDDRNALCRELADGLAHEIRLLKSHMRDSTHHVVDEIADHIEAMAAGDSDDDR